MSNHQDIIQKACELCFLHPDTAVILRDIRPLDVPNGFREMTPPPGTHSQIFQREFGNGSDLILYTIPF